MTKQEKIKQGYGIYSDIALGLCDENGWIKGSEYYTYFPQNKDKKIGIDEYIYFRPKSLQGIEDNNGWTKIESEKDLPDLIGENIIFYRNGLTTTYPSEDISEDKKTYLKYSHFKIRIKYRAPIY